MKSNIKIGINCFFLNKLRGMAKYSKRLIEKIPYEKVLFFSSDTQYTSSKDQVVAKGPKFYPLWEQYYLPKLVSKYKCTHLISPFNTQPVFLNRKVKRICVIHDLIFLNNTISCLQNKFEYFLPSIYSSINFLILLKSNSSFITVSKYSASNLSKFINKKKILVFPNSLDKEWWDFKFLGEREPFFFTVSGTTPNKNFKKLLKAFQIYRSMGGTNDLIVAGINKKNEIEKFLNKNLLNKHVKICPKMTDQEMLEKYKKCFGFISASTDEGFGIPLLEAMATKTPLLCGNTSSYPEVTQNNAIFFDPFDVLSISKALLNEQYITNELMVEKAYKGSLKYHPDNLDNYFKKVLEIF